MLHQFPFRVLGFHCDSGSEFLNHQVEKMLNKLLVEFTKSRAYRTTDNALVEGFNPLFVANTPSARRINNFRVNS
jgi:hypothetical protein